MPRTALLERRVPHSEIVLGRAYLISARNGGVGIAHRVGSCGIGYELHRVKWGIRYLFVEHDWEDDETFGTVIPMRLLPEEPPKSRNDWLEWLKGQEERYREEIEALRLG